MSAISSFVPSSENSVFSTLSKEATSLVDHAKGVKRKKLIELAPDFILSQLRPYLLQNVPDIVMSYINVEEILRESKSINAQVDAITISEVLAQAKQELELDKKDLKVTKIRIWQALDIADDVVDGEWDGDQRTHQKGQKHLESKIAELEKGIEELEWNKLAQQVHKLLAF